ncbi:MAG: cobalt-precorrin-5B (C(1))-methyltransferase CbiD [Tissierella sp.]|uniref:cobalt-precorrin-5B (C(1))-methyltransferase CbiD n=1 Tax=Tissierella sp. TaxID=41274 RepID=UPI003F9D9374
MTLDLYVVKNGENLRCGYTTGSCAAAAAKAAVFMLEKSKKIDYVEIDTPAGVKLKLELTSQKICKDEASCSVIKDAGDDPDVTDGIEIFAKVVKNNKGKNSIDGGIGVGRVTEKSLFGNVGEAAINKVPKEMIDREIKSISKNFYDIIIYVPMGEKIAKKTFNKNIGIRNGISIIGTKGIVYPMSDDALLKTIYMEVDMIAKTIGKEEILLVPGNYGEKLGKKLYSGTSMVKISNFIGESLLYIYKKGFKSIKILGHIGKISKLSIGVFNTHSKVCDTRLEAFVYYLALMGAPIDFIERINKLLTAEEALNVCIDNGYEKIKSEMEKGAEMRVKRYMKEEDFKISVLTYSMEKGV